MKFLCVPCDSPMRLASTAESEPGSLSVVYSCPQCGYEMAMLVARTEATLTPQLITEMRGQLPIDGATRTTQG